MSSCVIYNEVKMTNDRQVADVRADRLLNLLLLLQNGGITTTRRLAGELEVSERTVIRDMEALGTAGIPVYAERGPHGGWRLAEGYRMRLTGLTPRELMSLLLPPGILHDLDIRRDFDQAFRKLVAASPADLRKYADMLRERLHVDGTGWVAKQQAPNWLSAVQQAVWDNRKLAVRYNDATNTLFEGVVEPLGLIAKRNVWYMAANTDRGIFSYRVSRLQDARVLEETFVRPPDFDLARYWEQASDHLLSARWRYAVRLKLQEEKLASLPALSGNRLFQVRSRNPIGDGWLEAELDFRSREAALGCILGFGTHAEVLAPDDLRECVSETALAVAAMYGGMLENEQKGGG